MKWLRWTALGLLAVFVLIGAMLAWMLNSQSGTRTAFTLAQRALGGKLQVQRIDGTLAGPLTLTHLRFSDPAGGVEFSARLVRANVKLTALLHTTVHVSDADVRGVVVNSRPTTKPEPPPEPFTLEPPIDIVVDRFAASDIKIRNTDVPVLAIDKAAFQGRWTGAGIAVQRLDVRSPDGDVHFTANVRQDRIYVGDGRGSFRWRVGQQVYRGTLTADAKNEDARIALNLNKPVRARLNATLQQTEQLPWRFELRVPRFDPRDELLPDSTMQSLGATLRGEGSLQAGRIRGQLLIDGETLHLQPLQFARSETKLDIDGTLRINDAAGALRAVGSVQTDREPALADVKLDWDELIVPEKWAGQVLHTRGALTFKGSAEKYTSQGTLALGPPRQMANIELRVDGTPEVVQLQQFDITQPAGRLSANGTVGLKPNVQWDLKAQAQRFNPGAFAAQWPGDLNFALATTGRVTDAGPQLQLALTDLKGQLRQRALAGRADIELTADKVLAGVLDLTSGNSRVQVQGTRGNAMDAVLTLNVASLNDWLPDASGSVEGRYTITGRWPELKIAGTTSARELRVVNTRAATVDFQVDMVNPQHASGTASLDVTELSSAGFLFQRLHTDVSGNLKSHRIALNAVGSPLDTDIVVTGGLEQDTWTGSLQTLMLDVERAAHMTLRDPVPITYSPDGTRVSNGCLHDGNMELCAAADLRADGSLQAQYSLREVPLALANVLAPTLPIGLEGTLQGRGDIRRDVEGALFGRAEIRSPGGQVSQRVGESDEENQTLLRYADFSLVATLSGPDAQANVDARLDDRGRLQGNISATGLSEAATPIRGQLNADIPSLAPVALFVPQLANLSGTAAARIAVAGTVQEPQLTGQVRANDIAADVPMLGLHLRNGRIEVTPAADGAFQLAGGIRSGDGELQFDGSATQAGAVQMNMRGSKFLAADIPSARVIINPDLAFQRAEGGMKLSGEVEVPKAKVNLQKLPRGGRKVQQASSDVVVIDERTTQQEVASVPLEANIVVVLGEEVELTGFGLQARVDGRLGVREAPGEPTSGSGEIRISGQYKAYGQDLTIEQGQIFYAGTPIDNPRLNIVAVRKLEEQDVTAGLRITGSAQAPQLTVFSDPAMGEANALAYLVTGKPLDQVGADEGEGDMMQTAARSLGAATGGLLAKKIGKRLGVDEVSVKDSEALGGAAFTVGQYLSPRLFLSYGVGLFEPGEVITLRYKLSTDFAVQAERGPEDTRAGIQYRVER